MTSPSKLVWKNTKVRLGDLIDWEKNPRKLSPKQADDLRDSISKFGFIEPVVVDHDKKNLVGGHQRKRILLQRLLLDPDEMIDARYPNRALTPEEREEAAIRLNQNRGEWDYDILANQFETEQLFEWGFEPKEFGMSDDAGGGPAKETEPGVCPKCKRPL